VNGIKVDTISIERHPQIKKEMRVDHGEIYHQFNPWHLGKSVSKKLAKASKKSGCDDLASWIPSIVNHLWWSAESCNRAPDVLLDKWLSVTHQVTNCRPQVSCSKFEVSGNIKLSYPLGKLCSGLDLNSQTFN